MKITKWEKTLLIMLCLMAYATSVMAAETWDPEGRWLRMIFGWIGGH